jgi:tryptophanyl-tRNA synthetase
MVVTPWEVKGKVDYERLIKEFGTQPLTPELLKKVETPHRQATFTVRTQDFL